MINSQRYMVLNPKDGLAQNMLDNLFKNAIIK